MLNGCSASCTIMCGQIPDTAGNAIATERLRV